MCVCCVLCDAQGVRVVNIEKERKKRDMEETEQLESRQREREQQQKTELMRCARKKIFGVLPTANGRLNEALET